MKRINFESEILPNLSEEIDFSYFLNKGKRKKLAELLFNYLYYKDYNYLKNLKKHKLTEDYSEWETLLQSLIFITPHSATIGNTEASIQTLKFIFNLLKNRYLSLLDKEKQSDHNILKKKSNTCFNQNNIDDEEWLSLLEELSNNLQSEYKDDYLGYKNQIISIHEKIEKLTIKKKHIQNKIEFLEDNEDTNDGLIRKKHISILSRKREEYELSIEELKQKLELIYSLINEKITEDVEKLQKVWQTKELADQIEDIQSKVTEMLKSAEKLSKLFGSLEMFLGRGWDLSKGFWKRIKWDQLERYASLLENESDLKEFADLLGRYESTEKDFLNKELKKITKTKFTWKAQKGGKSQLKGVELSDDVSLMLASEAALLSEGITKPLFYQKIFEKKLMTYEMDDSILFSIETDDEKEVEVDSGDKKGPIIICVDSSGSMHGLPERVAKVLTFAILKIALKDKRKCFLISFSDSQSIEELELTQMNSSLDLLINFLQYSFHGGTDPTEALNRSMEKIEGESFQKADVLMITDGQFNLDSYEIENIKNKKKKNNCSIFTLLINDQGRKPDLSFCNQVWRYSKNGLENGVQLVRRICVK